MPPYDATSSSSEDEEERRRLWLNVDVFFLFFFLIPHWQTVSRNDWASLIRDIGRKTVVSGNKWERRRAREPRWCVCVCECSVLGEERVCVWRMAMGGGLRWNWYDDDEEQTMSCARHKALSRLHCQSRLAERQFNPNCDRYGSKYFHWQVTAMSHAAKFLPNMLCLNNLEKLKLWRFLLLLLLPWFFS